MENIKSFFLEFLEKIDHINVLEKQYEIKYQKILEHKMSIYSKVITINDLKQFYLAKLQTYLKDELKKGLEEKLNELIPILQEIHLAYNELQTTLDSFKMLKNVNYIFAFHFNEVN